jgi:TM2 domain-containing membrane protein YozV
MEPKNKYVAGMLAIFLGWMGADKIYLKETGGWVMHIFMLFLSIKIGVPIILFMTFFKGLHLLNMSDHNFDKKYNSGTSMPVKKGPLEVRREAQMRKFDQVPGQSGTTVMQHQMQRKPSPQSTVKANPFKASGIKKYKDFDLDDAIEDFKKGLAIAPSDVALHFNIACAYSLTEKKSLAYHHISKAVSLGMQDVERIMSHDDLAYVRIQPEWENFRKSGFLVNPYPTPQQTTQPEQSGQIPSAPPVSSGDENNLLDSLKKLAEMRENGVISDEEFVVERKRLLRQ